MHGPPLTTRNSKSIMVFGFFKKSAKKDETEQSLKDQAVVEPQESTVDTPVDAGHSDGGASAAKVAVSATELSVSAELDLPPNEPAVTQPGDSLSPALALKEPQILEPADPKTATTKEAFMPAVSSDQNEDERKQGLFARMKAGLSKTGSQLSGGLGNIFMGLKEINDDLLEELETQLLLADVGIEATESIMENLAEQLARNELSDTQALYKALQKALVELLEPVQCPLMIDTQKKPFVILVVGVNGVGKTTTIGKLAKGFQNQGKQVMLAAGDTFRAAAVEQLQVWGDRNDVPVVAQHTGADSASVIFDAIQSAQSKNTDILIADTAGRLHNKDNLMEELSKVKRVMAKLDDSAPHEVLLVLDAGTGQNAINQAQQFRDSAGVTGLALTKLDGTAKGGVIFALAKQLNLPVRFIGVGEGIDDLQPFDAKVFVKALFSEEAK